MALPALAAQSMMREFRELRRLGGFLTSFYRPIEGSTGKTSDTVSWDIVRYQDLIAGTVDKNTGANINKTERFSTKDIEPPTYNEAVAINSADLVNRLPGENPFSAAERSYTSRFITAANEALVEMDALISRSVEVQASQIFQTGELALEGARPFAADFFPKASHFPSASTVWSDATNAVPLDDLESLANQIKTDSRRRVMRAIFGRTALREFLATDQVTGRADIARFNLVNVDPRLQDFGASRYGLVTTGAYDLEMWQYDDEFEPLAGGGNQTYVDDDKVILLPDYNQRGGLVVTSVIVPQILPPDPRVAAFISMPTRSRAGYDLVPNVWTDSEGLTINAGFRTRVVLIPQEIDGFGCLTT